MYEVNYINGRTSCVGNLS